MKRHPSENGQLVYKRHDDLRSALSKALGIGSVRMILSGGGSLLYGIDRMIEDSTHIRTMIVDDPLACAAHGAGKLLTKLDSMQDGMMNFLRNREMRN